MKPRRLFGCVLLLIVALLPMRASAQTEVVEYYGVDALGSVRVVFDSAGNLVNRIDYGPFGEQLTGSNFNRRVYAKLFRDGETAQDYATARMYQSRTGRFSTMDPVFADLFSPQNLNRYSYALNSPLMFTDELGLCPACENAIFTFIDSLPRFTDSTGVTATVGTSSSMSGSGSGGYGLEGVAQVDQSGTEWTFTDASWASSATGAGTLAGTAIGTTIAVQTQSRVDEIDNIKFGKHDPTIKKKFFQWQRTFHMDWDYRYGYHFNADWGPLKFANHRPVHHLVHAVSTKGAFRVAAGGAGSAAVVMDVYNIATADNKCVAAAGAIGGVVGGAAGAWFGSAIPGPGTIVGGAAGGAAGGWVGEKLGTYVCR